MMVKYCCWMGGVLLVIWLLFLFFVFFCFVGLLFMFSLFVILFVIVVFVFVCEVVDLCDEVGYCFCWVVDVDWVSLEWVKGFWKFLCFECLVKVFWVCIVKFFFVDGLNNCGFLYGIEFFFVIGFYVNVGGLCFLFL